MRAFTLALCGLTALCRALPVGDEAAQLEERQFAIGPPTVTLCVGSCKPSSPIWFPQPTATSGFHIGRREVPEAKREDTAPPAEKRGQVEDIVSTCVALASSLSPSEANSAFKLIIEECFLLFKQHDVDFALLGGWTSIGISNKAKRQGEIIIGACTEGDIAALTTQFKAIVAQYGRDNIPYDIAVLLEAIKAALFYCALASPTTGPLEPDDVIIGTPLNPDPYVPGGPLEPDEPIEGGGIVPSD